MVHRSPNPPGGCDAKLLPASCLFFLGLQALMWPASTWQQKFSVGTGTWSVLYQTNCLCLAYLSNCAETHSIKHVSALPVNSEHCLGSLGRSLSSIEWTCNWIFCSPDTLSEPQCKWSSNLLRGQNRMVSIVTNYQSFRMTTQPSTFKDLCCVGLFCLWTQFCAQGLGPRGQQHFISSKGWLKRWFEGTCSNSMPSSRHAVQL